MPNRFRVVFTADAVSTPGEKQLHDIKFDKYEDAFTKAASVISTLSYMQEFDSHGTPVNTYSPEMIREMI